MSEPSSWFLRNRQTVMARMAPGGVALFFAAPELVRNGDVHHDYRQDSDFWFLTGFEEPQAVLVLAPERDEGDRVHLFVQPKDPDKEAWDGARLGVDEAPKALGIDRAWGIEGLKAKLRELLVGPERIYFALGRDRRADQVVTDALEHVRYHGKRGDPSPGTLQDTVELVHELRVVKCEQGREAMRAAARLAALGHRRGMAITRPGIFEYELQAAMEYAWRARGSRRNAYDSIVGSGLNACVLHYRDSRRQTRAGDLVLVDAAPELGYHAADITRTWPVSGRFSAPQRDVYEIVLDAQKLAVAQCRAGCTFDSVHKVATRRLVEGMIDLGLLQGGASERIEDESYKRWYMHKTGHWLGLDVHDVGRYRVDGESRVLVPGMVLTVEPGLYISGDDAPEALRGIGIRVEDDVLVTEDEPEILSAGAPKEIDEIEALVGSEA